MQPLDSAKNKLGSDSEIARFLGVSRQFVNDVRSGRINLTAVQIARLYDLLGEDWLKAMIRAEADKAKRPADRKFLLGKFATLSVLILLSVSTILARGVGEEWGGTMQTTGQGNESPNVYYVKSWKMLLRRIERLRSWIKSSRALAAIRERRRPKHTAVSGTFATLHLI